MKNMTLKMAAFAAFVALAIPLAAYATAEIVGSVDFFAETRAAQFIKGIYIGPKVGTKRATVDTMNKITAHRVCSTTFDFPAIAATNGASATGQTCVRSWNVTCTGVKVGDRCNATSNFGADGGSALPAYVHPFCSVTAADTEVVDLCGNLNDGGTYDATDAGYFMYTDSFQAQ